MATLVLDGEPLMVEDGGVCITISGITLSCPGEKAGFKVGCCVGLLFVDGSSPQHFLRNHFLSNTKNAATDAIIAHIKNPTIFLEQISHLTTEKNINL